MFTGLERDAESALDHTWFRQYSSAQARWLSPDPLGGTISNPQSLNRYSYVGNNALNFTDPLGLLRLGGEDDDDLRYLFGGGGWGFNCQIDNVDGPCGLAHALLRTGGATFCYNPAECRGRFNDDGVQIFLPGHYDNTARGVDLSNGNIRVTSDYFGPRWAHVRSAQEAEFDTLRFLSDFSAGAGDFLSFGITSLVRENLTPAQGVVDTQSGAYTAGQVTGAAVSAATGALSVARASSGLSTRIAIHGPHHSFGSLGRLSHLQINWWHSGRLPYSLLNRTPGVLNDLGTGVLRVALPWR